MAERGGVEPLPLRAHPASNRGAGPTRAHFPCDWGDRGTRTPSPPSQGGFLPQDGHNADFKTRRKVAADCTRDDAVGGLQQQLALRRGSYSRESATRPPEAGRPTRRREAKGTSRAAAIHCLVTTLRSLASRAQAQRAREVDGGGVGDRTPVLRRIVQGRYVRRSATCYPLYWLAPPPCTGSATSPSHHRWRVRSLARMATRLRDLPVVMSLATPQREAGTSVRLIRRRWRPRRPEPRRERFPSLPKRHPRRRCQPGSAGWQLLLFGTVRCHSERSS